MSDLPYRSPDNWPLLICGPMLRRVEKDLVSVFVATSSGCNVELLVYTPEGAPAWSSDMHSTRRLGDRLHVSVCTLSNFAGGGFLEGKVYRYDLRLTPQDPVGAPQTLANQQGLLKGDFPLGYEDDELPTFSLPPGLDRLTVLHGSCRKPHGGGPDALQIADILLDVARTEAGAGTRENALRRPHQLFLTGDQIYADDVALTLLPVITALGQELIGSHSPERFPGGFGMTDDELRPGTKREIYLKTSSTITSEHCQGHLLFFAEFCAMYLLAWSDELWPPEASTARGQLEEEVRSYAASVRSVRRALANVPTMMMFDDHEITDDWNLDGFWHFEALGNPITKQIIRNGLLAFAVFQAWGNDPQAWSQGVHKSVLDAITVMGMNVAPPLADDAEPVDSALGLAPASGPNRVRWNWVLDAQEHRVIALDTRTRRGYPSDKGPAALLTDQETRSQLTDHKPDSGKLALIISPAPVNGYPLVEAVIQPAAVALKGGYYGDNEPWTVNLPAYENFLGALSAFGRVVLLSGDVHYAFSNHMAYFGIDGRRARIVQLCSTALKNSDGKTNDVEFVGYGLGTANRVKSQGWLGFADGVDSKLRTLLWRELENQAEKALDVYRTHLFLRALEKLRKHPEWYDDAVNSEMACVPDGPWVTEERVKALADLMLRSGARNWAYRITYVRDSRPRAARLADVWSKSLWEWQLVDRSLIANSGRDVVGKPNLGVITFRTVDGQLEVVHRIHWILPFGEDENPVTQTLHVAPLSIPNAAERPAPRRSL